MRKFTGVLAALFLLASCGGNADGADTAPSPSPSPIPETFTAKGTLLLITANLGYADGGKRGDTCWGSDGYDDIREGAQVVIRGPKGNKIGLGHLTAGVITKRQTTCGFLFNVPNIPERDGIYSVEVAQRGEISFTRDEADAIGLTLG